MRLSDERIKILIVDDELPIREWLAYAISSIKTKVELVGVCKDGSEALEVYSKENPDILITDIKMPNMNGIEVLKQIKIYDEKAYVIMLTSHDDFELARESLKYGASEYILKNEITSEVLEHIVDSFVQKSQNETKSKFVIDDTFEIKSAFSGDFEKAQKLINDVGILNNDQFVLMAHIKQGTDFSVFNNLGYKTDCVESGLIYKYDKNKAVFIVQLVHSSSHMEKYNFVMILAKEIEDICVSPVGVSEILRESMTIENAIKSSLYALGMSYYEKRPTCMYTSYKAVNGDVQKELVKKRNKIIELINIMNYEKAKLAIADFFEYIKAEKIADIECVKLTLVDFIASYKLSKLEFSSENLGKKAAQYQDKIQNAVRIMDMESIIYEFIKGSFEVEDYIEGGYSKYVNKAIAYIREKYATIELIKEISDYLGLNLEYLCRLFKSETGDTINNFLTDQRIKVACHLLKTTDLKVNEVAEMVGYNSLSYFSRTFRKKMNISPNDYRYKLQKNNLDK